MACGDWRLPRQFNGLITRSESERELRPFECLEIEGGKHEEPAFIPKCKGWVIAQEDYEDIRDLQRVWHYVDRLRPIETGMRAYVYYKLTMEGYVWYKPYPVDCAASPRSAEGQAPDLLFRQVPGDMALRMEMDRGFDDWTLEFYNCFSGNFVTSLHYHRTEKVTWKGLHLALRHNLLEKHLITGGMSFKVFYENSEPTSLQALVFKPYKFDEVEGPQADATPKAKPKNTPKAKSVVKRPAVAKSVLKRPGSK